MQELVMVMEKSEPLPVGKHAAKLVYVDRMDGPHGPMIRFHFTVNHEEDVHKVTGLASRILKRGTKLARWVTALHGHEPEVGETVKARELLNKTCQVEIEHNTSDDGYVFANVVDVEAEVPF